MTSSSKVPAETIGLASLARVAADPNGVKYVWDSLIVQLTDAPDDVGASLTLSTLLQLTGNRDKGLELQASAIAAQRSYKSTHGAGDGLRILAFMTAGDFMANTPLDFLLEGSDAELISVYIDGPPPPASELPDHDVAFLAIGQSETNDRLLARLGHAFDRWPTKVINNRPDRIAALTRDGVAASFAGHPTILAPATRRVARDSLANLPEGVTFPIIVRPAGSHAGHGLEQATDAAGLTEYLGRHDDAEFYVSPFIDYSGPDGQFRKLRVVFIDGEAFVSHMAVSPRWMVHYLNADMETNAANRAEEAEMMATFDTGFAVRHAAAFRTLIDTFQLDYFGIDCAETADGRLLLFEADVAMIVHAMDPPELYPYKKPAMAKLFSAFMAFMAAAAVEHAPLVPA
jgi:glutathione synthase/RimK-type ligase-like ATP-grasp enzyme